MPVELIQFTGTDPIANLAMEEYLARNRQGPGIHILLYRNRSAVVIGRNQNPWRECDPESLKKMGIPLVRRISGGGAVYHDLGNLNYSFILPRSEYAPERHVDTICRALAGVGVPAKRNDRNDIMIGECKISGTAYLLSGGLAMHHGTLLVETDLPVLREALTPAPRWSFETKAIASVRTKVVNIRDITPDFDIAEFVKSLAAEIEAEWQPLLRKTLNTTPETLPDAVGELMKKHTEQEWLFGRTPPFSATFAVPGGKVLRKHVKAGRITVSEPDGSDIGSWFCTEIDT